ncbi:MAG: hypothetical protein N3F07_04230 [Candidatus Micrarchaeota archaeon]|nr:hypothetical protein [Candidatus Micrarchaeota archaeon]
MMRAAVRESPKQLHPSSQRFRATEPIAEFALGDAGDLNERLVALKAIARNSENPRLAALAVLKIWKLKDAQILESLAGYAHLQKTSMLALRLLEKEKDYDAIMNAIFSSSDYGVIKYGLKILIRNDCIEHLKEIFARANHKVVKRMVLQNLLSVIDVLIEKKDVEALAHIAKSKQEEWAEILGKKRMEGGYGQEEYQEAYDLLKAGEVGKIADRAQKEKRAALLECASLRIRQAIENREFELLASIAKGVEKEFSESFS